MQLQHFHLLALAGLGAATKACVPTHTASDTVDVPTSTPTFKTSICVDYTSPCGSPPTATVWYGGCHDITVSTTYTPPPCPTGGGYMTSCTSSGTTICDERYRTCGSPVPTTTLTYGACHDACVTLTYSQPACPVPTYIATA